MFRPFFASVYLLLALMLPAATTLAAPAPGHEHAPSADAAPLAQDALVPVAPGQVVVQVSGVVCSFCAQGVSRALRKLPGLDAALYQKGVLVEIEQQRVVLAFREGATLPLRAIDQKIRSGGYEARRYHLRIKGVLRDAAAAQRVLETADGARFRVAITALPSLATAKQVELQVVVEAVALAAPGPLAARVLRWFPTGGQDE